MTQDPTLGDLLLRLQDKIKGSTFVGQPATIVAYDAATQRATVQPSVAIRMHDAATDTLLPQVIPPISDVPVIWSSAAGGAASVTLPLSPGDPVWLAFADRSLDEWKGGQVPPVVPRDTRRHDLTDPVAFVGGSPTPLPADASAPGAMVIRALDIRMGSAAAISAVVLEDLLRPHLDALKAYVDGHVHFYIGDSGASLYTTPPSEVLAPPVFVASLSPPVPVIGASKVKAE